jgi:hypothetical protein
MKAAAPAQPAAPKQSVFKAGTKVRNISTGKTGTLQTDGQLPDGFEAVTQ